ncbi:MAG: DsbA family protein [Nitrososphaerota archaeon]|nr:DsbA family protein [Nitrososphaerota archaeon]
MNQLYYLAIPIILGTISIFFLFGMENDEEVLFDKKNLMENGSPLLGDSSAQITILEWGDYQCTFCYRFHQSSLNIILEEYIDSGKINFVFKDFPLNGPDSILAAEATYCAEDQGKYWAFHNELYSNWAGEKTGWINYDSLNQFAKSVNLELDEFTTCLDEHKYNQKVLELEKFGKKIGIDATPSFLIFNDEKIIKIRGNQPIDVFRQAIDDL